MQLLSANNFPKQNQAPTLKSTKSSSKLHIPVAQIRKQQINNNSRKARPNNSPEYHKLEFRQTRYLTTRSPQDKSTKSNQNPKRKFKKKKTHQTEMKKENKSKAAKTSICHPFPRINSSKRQNSVSNSENKNFPGRSKPFFFFQRNKQPRSEPQKKKKAKQTEKQNARERFTKDREISGGEWID